MPIFAYDDPKPYLIVVNALSLLEAKQKIRAEICNIYSLDDIPNYWDEFKDDIEQNYDIVCGDVEEITNL